jgi:hypothetical protein
VAKEGTQSRLGTRQIVGFSLAPDLAAKVKSEAARRKIKLRSLFEEMWMLYQEARKSARDDGR